jgi:hypothetical protein
VPQNKPPYYRGLDGLLRDMPTQKIQTVASIARSKTPELKSKSKLRVPENDRLVLF